MTHLVLLILVIFHQPAIPLSLPLKGRASLSPLRLLGMLRKEGGLHFGSAKSKAAYSKGIYSKCLGCSGRDVGSALVLGDATEAGVKCQISTKEEMTTRVGLKAGSCGSKGTRKKAAEERLI